MFTCCARLLFASILLLAAPARAGLLHDASANLSPGQFAWADAGDPADPLSLVVSIEQQRLYVYRGPELIGVAAVSTGKPGHETPHGTYTILQKAKWHRSNLYSNAPMPYMQRLTWTGIALHAGYDPGYPVSHGCIRLPAAFARALFEMTGLGGSVIVTDYPPEAPVELDVEPLWLVWDDTVTAPPKRGKPLLHYAEAVFLIP